MMDIQQRDTQFLVALRDIIKPNHDAHVRTFRASAIKAAMGQAKRVGLPDADNMPVGGLVYTLGELGE